MTRLIAFVVIVTVGHPAHGKPRTTVPAPRTGTVDVPVDHLKRSSGTRKLYFERYCRSSSEKHPLILLHGGPGAPMPVARVLQSPFGDVLLRHFDVVYFEQRGTGRSLTEAEKQRKSVIRNRQHYRLEQYVADLDLLRARLFDRRPVMLVGASWGGFLGLAYALKHPGSVKALILGSFAASGRYAMEVCGTFDRMMLAAEVRHPKLRGALGQLRLAIARGKVVWRRGSPKRRVLRHPDVIELALPLAMKARYAQMTQLLQAVAVGQAEGQRFLDKLDLEHGEMATAGGSLPGEATFCQTFVGRSLLESLQRDPPPATHCDSRAVSRAMLKLCQPYLGRARVFDVTARLPELKVPALIFAGQWDPVLDWRETLRVALGLPRATFVLVDGGHTPVAAGGACLARAVDAFVSGKRVDASCFVASWPGVLR